MRKSFLAASIAAPALVLATPYIGHLSAYANTLTGLIPSLYQGLDVVSRELVGFIPAVSRAPGAERAAVGQSVVYQIAPAANVVDVTPAMQVPTPAGQTIGNDSIVITKSKAAEFGWTGEEQRGLNTGPGYLNVQADMFAQGLRALTNLIETDLGALAISASRATGTAGTTPFGSADLTDLAQVRKILDDNGAPGSGRSLVMNTSAGAKLRPVSNLSKANESGTVMTLRDGELLNVYGLSLKESAQVLNFTAGTGASATTNTAGYAVGATAITFAAAGTGTILAGEVITFAGDVNKYVVKTGIASAAAGGVVTIAAPGLRVALPASAVAVTVIASHAANIAFSTNAIALVTRAPALPQQGDLAIDRISITDPRSGMVYEISLYPGYRMVRAEVAIAWGVKAVKSEHIAMLLG